MQDASGVSLKAAKARRDIAFRVICERKGYGGITPRTCGRDKKNWLIYNAMNELPVCHLALLNFPQMLSRCFNFASAIYHSTSLRRCIRTDDLMLVLEVIGDAAFDHCLQAVQDGTIVEREPASVLSGRALVQALRDAIAECAEIWNFILPPPLRKEIPQGAETIGAFTSSEGGVNCHDSSLSKCLLEEIAATERSWGIDNEE